MDSRSAQHSINVASKQHMKTEFSLSLIPLLDENLPTPLESLSGKACRSRSRVNSLTKGTFDQDWHKKFKNSCSKQLSATASKVGVIATTGTVTGTVPSTAQRIDFKLIGFTDASRTGIVIGSINVLPDNVCNTRYVIDCT